MGRKARPGVPRNAVEEMGTHEHGRASLVGHPSVRDITFGDYPVQVLSSAERITVHCALSPGNWLQSPDLGRPPIASRGGFPFIVCCVRDPVPPPGGSGPPCRASGHIRCVSVRSSRGVEGCACRRGPVPDRVPGQRDGTRGKVMTLHGLKSRIVRLWPGRADPHIAPPAPPEPEPVAIAPADDAQEQRDTARRCVEPAEALAGFVEWMNAGGFAGQWWPSIEIAGFFAWYCADTGIEEMNPDTLLAMLREPSARFSAGRRRLNQPMFDDLRAYLERMPSRGTVGRAVLYRTPLMSEISESGQALALDAMAGRAEPERRITTAGRRSRGEHERLAA